MRRIAVLACLALLAGCGSDDSSSSPAKPALTVSAAASLKNAVTDYGKGFSAATVRPSFAGSDELAAQIRQGVKPDVFASANTKLPDQLYAEGLVEKPVVFASNQLVLAVPPDSSIKGLADLAKPGTTIAMGSPSVPVGSYTRKVLDGLPADQKKAILANVRSNEPDVGGVVGKVAQGAVDAGFVYVTDVEATDGKLKAIDLPEDLKPQVAYGVAVVKGAKHPEQAQQFVDGLLDGAGQQALQRAGFLPPP
ncbi:molybdate ABC transporter substrate-binding protein [Solirubrobacter ginsenosidimutans]|uniref:Molybdate ABC transporter substrate-binding protein n=1 Tax=Solirubrobacter ginsenosidimutans TaxID=490573 RepID=A0A9X3MRJ9_9ACTN|nr:molybdate ABC transporter substrate-binding protein [Solirubrobacter ginsenosidimutans]MDA0161140.1 molybdate ABC transporter substrate-binding protein [Solirubrobacter ginsenosidimutans]